MEVGNCGYAVRAIGYDDYAILELVKEPFESNQDSGLVIPY